MPISCSDTHTCEHNHLPMHAHTPYSYVHFRNIESGLTDFEIDEVAAGASLSTNMSPTTERTTPFNPRIDIRKCEYPCQVEDLNMSGYVPP